MKLGILLAADLVVFCGGAAVLASPAGEVIGWGDNVSGMATGVPTPEAYYSTGIVVLAGHVLRDAVAIAAGSSHSLALRSNGSVVGWGGNIFGGATGRPNEAPYRASGAVLIGGEPLTNVVAISAGRMTSLALRKDGTVVSWGKDVSRERQGPAGIVAGVSNVIAISAGWGYDVVLKRDGTVTSWGIRHVPAGLTNIVAIDAGAGDYAFGLALKSNGTVVKWGPGGQEEPVPPGLTNVTAIASGGGHCLALLSNATVFGWGSNTRGESTGTPSPTGVLHSDGELVRLGGLLLTNVVRIAAGMRYSLALRRDGTVVGWGYNGFHQTDVPAGLRQVIAIAAGETFCLALTTNVPSSLEKQP